MDNKHIQFTIETKAIDLEARTIRVLASAPVVDSDNELVPVTAFKDLSRFKSNPVILSCHQHRLSDGSSPVVGRAEKIWTDKAGLWVIIKFAETELGEQYWTLYRDGFMKAVSTGFNVIKSHPEFIDGKNVTVLDEILLYEISCVPIGANPLALTKSKQKHLDWLMQKKAEKYVDDEFAEMLLGVKDCDFCGGSSKENFDDDTDKTFMEELGEELKKRGWSDENIRNIPSMLEQEGYEIVNRKLVKKAEKMPDFKRHFARV